MANSKQLRDSLVSFLRQEHRNGSLLANPDQICTIAFLDRLATFIERQQCACVICDAVAERYAQEVEMIRRREGRP